jgi:hypothetical protein
MSPLAQQHPNGNCVDFELGADATAVTQIKDGLVELTVVDDRMGLTVKLTRREARDLAYQVIEASHRMIEEEK